MRLNFKNVLKGLTAGSLLIILTVIYVLSAYFILHTTWVYNNPNSYLSDHHKNYVLVNDEAHLFLFLPFGVSAYYYSLRRNGKTRFALIRGIFDFLSTNVVANFSVFYIKNPIVLFLLALIYVFVFSMPGILYLWVHLNPKQKTMTYKPTSTTNNTNNPQNTNPSKPNNTNNPQNTNPSVSNNTNNQQNTNTSTSNQPAKPAKPKIMIYANNLKQTINQQVIGQSYAKEEIVKQFIMQARKSQAAGYGFHMLGTFFFVGPTGVGKTETAKAIYEYFKQYGYQFLRFDMGNFGNPHDAATLTGSPRGYVGSEEGGALTRPLMNNNRAVILFDEMEKASPVLFRTFMTLLDEGEIQETSTGTRVTLDNAIIIFTSNMYQGTIKEIITKEQNPVVAEVAIRNLLTGNYSNALKYVSQEQIQMEKPPENVGSHGMTNKFPPEFMGRIDKVIPFTSLSEEDYKVIVNRLAVKYKKNVDVDAITKKNLPIAEEYGVRQFIKKVEEDILL